MSAATRRTYCPLISFRQNVAVCPVSVWQTSLSIIHTVHPNPTIDLTLCNFCQVSVSGTSSRLYCIAPSGKIVSRSAGVSMRSGSLQRLCSVIRSCLAPNTATHGHPGSAMANRALAWRARHTGNCPPYAPSAGPSTALLAQIGHYSMMIKPVKWKF